MIKICQVCVLLSVGVFKAIEAAQRLINGIDTASYHGPDKTMRATLIGLGNILMRDEGVGVHAVRFIQEHYDIPPEVEIVDGGTIGLGLLPYIEGRDRVLFVDAVNFRKEPGYIGVLENQEIPTLFGTKDSLHHLGLMDVLAAATLLEVTPKEICLIGIQPQTLETGLELTVLLQGKMPMLAKKIIAKLQDWGLSCSRR